MKLEQIEQINESMGWIVKSILPIVITLVTKMVVSAIKKHGEQFMIDIIVDCSKGSDNKVMKIIEKMAMKHKSYDKGTIHPKGKDCEMIFTFDNEEDMEDFKKEIEYLKKNVQKSVKTFSVKKK